MKKWDFIVWEYALPSLFIVVLILSILVWARLTGKPKVQIVNPPVTVWEGKAWKPETASSSVFTLQPAMNIIPAKQICYKLMETQVCQ